MNTTYPTDYLSSGFGWLVIIWLLIITGLLIAVAVLGWTGKIDVGPTGPAGSIGPTGPTGPRAGEGLTTIGSSIITVPHTCTCTPTTSLPPTLPVNTSVAFCNPCQFYSLNADISNYQVIPGPNIPTIVRWAFSNALNTTYIHYATNGVFTLTPGRYQLSATIIYPPTTRMGTSNVGGTYKYMAIMLTDTSFNNVVSDAFLIDKSQPIPIGTNNLTTLTLNTTFTVTNRPNLSILTWHDSTMPLEIGSLSTLPPINSTFHLIRL